MNRKLTAKVQKLNANLTDVARSFSNAIVINPDDEGAREKYGTLYAIYDVLGSVELDTLLVSKIVHDILHDSYFQSENTSPIQSLEKAVISVRERVLKISSESGGSASEFNILVTALWGNVLYLVQFGRGGSYLMREGVIKPIQAASEGNFTVASGVVKDNDVVIIGTSRFLDLYQPETLINNTQPISANELPIEASALVLKFAILSDFTEGEMLSAQTPEAVYSINQSATASISQASPVNASTFINKKPGFKFKNVLPKLNRKSASVTGLRTPLVESVGGKKNPYKKVVPIVAGLFLLSLVFTFISNSYDPTFLSGIFSREEEKSNQNNEPEDSSNKEDVESIDITKETIDPQADFENKVVRVEESVFYDLKLVDENVNLTTALVLDDNVLVADTTSGKVFSSTLTTAKFEALTNSFPGITSLSYLEGNAAFSDDEGYKVYNVTTDEVETSYVDETVGKVSAAYLDFVYSITGDEITKFTKEGNILTGSTWGQSADFTDSSSLSIAINIYLLTKDGELVSYLSGEKTNYSIADLDTPFNNPKQVIADLDFDYIYVADAGNKRVVLVNSLGEFIKQYKHTRIDAWNDIRAIGVSRDENTLFVVSGTKVYEVDLTKDPIDPNASEDETETTDTEE